MLVRLFRARVERIRATAPSRDGYDVPAPVRRLSNRQFFSKHGFVVEKVPVKVN